jgi:hypothetical protein
MTEADEKDFATMAQTALSQIKAEMERTGNSTPVFLVRLPDGKIQKLPFPEQAGRLMNDGVAKDMIFGAIRMIVQESGMTAVCFATEAWSGKQTEAGRNVPREEFLKATRERGFQRAVDRGWVVRQECIIVTIQTAEMMRTITQAFARDEEARIIVYLDEPEIRDAPQSDFAGRQKMYGDLREENLS